MWLLQLPGAIELVIIVLIIGLPLLTLLGGWYLIRHVLDRNETESATERIDELEQRIDELERRIDERE